MIHRKSHRNDAGFTMAEMLFATFITVVGLLGLLKVVEIATTLNIQSQMRSEMAQVAASGLDSFRAIPFTSISTCRSCPGALYTYPPMEAGSNLRGITKRYSVMRSTIVSGDGSTVDLGVRVRSWAYRNTSTAIEVHSVRGQ